jgi:hypothetical protein
MADLTGMMQAAAGVGGEEADEYFQNTVLLLHGDGINGQQNNVFLDSSSNAFAITRNGDTTQGTFSPFSKPDGAWGNYFDGTGDYLTVPDNGDLDLGTGDFCVEFFWYPQSTNAAQYPLIGDSTGDWYVIWESGNLSLGRRAQGNDVSTTGFTLAQNTWQHICVTRQSTGTNDTRIFVNGVLYGVGTSSQNYVITTTLAIGSTQSATNPITGYLSNVRVIKGSVPVEYQTASTTTGISIFTPPTSALTAVSGTELLICQSNRFVDNSANAFAITVAGDTKVTPFSPFPLTTEYSPSVNGGSGYFDSTGDYLQAGSNAAFSFGTGDFTAEGWIYGTGNTSTTRTLFVNGGASGGSFGVFVNSSNQIQLDYYGGTSLNSGATTIALNAWYHWAVAREGSNISIFINGSRAATTTTTSNNTSNTLDIGTGWGSNLWFGYMSSFRIVKGSAVYDPTVTTYTIPTAPLTAIANTSLLCNFTNSGILDNTCFNDLITVGDAAVNTTTKKYGTGSMEFDGTGDYLKAAFGNNFDFGTGPFTVEFWLYLNATTNQCFLDLRTGSPFLFDYNSNALRYFANSTVITGSALSTGQWYHIALTRDSSSDNRMFVDGTQTGSTVSNSTNLTGTTIAYIGANYVGGDALNGFIDDLRITKGVARYTTTFTPPTKAFPNIGS